jgi:hypothetical protein
MDLGHDRLVGIIDGPKFFYDYFLKNLLPWKKFNMMGFSKNFVTSTSSFKKRSQINLALMVLREY